MKYDIYFHNDFDGRASAALMLSFLRSRGDDIEHFIPVNYHLIPQWLREDFFEKHKLFKGKRNPVIIVDFLYHPAAAFWFDHHPTTFKKESWKQNFRVDKQHRLVPNYISCTHLVYDSLKKDFGWKPGKHSDELVKWLDVIDGARYKSPKQTIALKEPALQINRFIEGKEHSAEGNRRLVYMLSEKPLWEIAALPEVQSAVGSAKKKWGKAMVFLKKNTKVTGGVAFIDRSESKLDFPRFGSQSLFPRALYFVRVSRRDGLYHVNVGASPWKRDQGVLDVGKMLSHFGGGGHKAVGGVELKSRIKSLAMAATFVKKINDAIEEKSRGARS